MNNETTQITHYTSVKPCDLSGSISRELYEHAQMQIRKLISTDVSVLDLPVGPNEIPFVDLEWCEMWAYDEDAEPGMPQEVITQTVEQDPLWDTEISPAPHYAIAYLSCGHTIAQLC